jgi:hypothetical protein
MNYQQYEKATELKALLDSKTTIRTNHNLDQQVLEEDLNWSTLLFLAKAVHLALPLNCEYTAESFCHFKRQYEIRTGVPFNTQRLFEKFWLRNIMGYIEMAGSVHPAILTYDKISEYRNELQFLSEFTQGIPAERRAIPETDLRAAIDDFELRNNIRLSNDGVYFNQWLSKGKDDGTVSISPIDIYFRPYLVYWEEFQFLSALKKEKQEDTRGLLIHKDELEQLHTSFGKFFVKTPSLQALVTRKLFTDADEYYCLNFWNSEIKYWWNLADKITGRYWEILVDDKNIPDDEARVKKFLEQTFFLGKSS